MPDHASLTDPELHEPKGVASASLGKVYRADGSGSGAWTDPKVFSTKPQYGELILAANATATTLTAASTVYDIAGTWDDTLLSGFTQSTNRLVVPTSGVYRIDANVVLTHAIGTDDTLRLILGAASSYAVNTALGKFIQQTCPTGKISRLGFSILWNTTTVGQELHLGLANISNASTSVTVSYAQFSAQLIKEN